MSDNTTSDTDYIEDKVNSQNSSSNSSKSPNYGGFVMTIIQSMIQLVLLFCISAGFIVNINNPKYRDSNGDFVNWPGSDINGPPYAPDQSSNSRGGSIKKSVLSFFDLSKYGSPYNLPDMQKLLAKQKQLDEYNKTADHSSGSKPPDVSGVDPQAQLWPWAIRMTALSYCWMRSIFQAGLISVMPTNNSSHAQLKNSAIFGLAWAPLLMIFAGMFWIAPIMTVVGAVASFKPWGWVGGGGLISLFMMFFFPGFFYGIGVFLVPMLTAMLNAYIQPFYYLGFLLEPIFKNFGEVKDIMLQHSHVIGIAGIVITIMSAIQNSINAPGFIIGVVLMAIITIVMGPGKQHIQGAMNKMMNKN